MTEPNPVGRPPMYASVEEMQTKIDGYFTTHLMEEQTVTGLALALGFTSRAALINYEDKPEFVNAVKKAKLKIENAYEYSLRKNGRSGDIFALKNFGWNDSQNINLGGQNGENPVEANLTVTFVKPQQ